jgi:hypothetical protein
MATVVLAIWVALPLGLETTLNHALSRSNFTCARVRLRPIFPVWPSLNRTSGRSQELSGTGLVSPALQSPETRTEWSGVSYAAHSAAVKAGKVLLLSTSTDRLRPYR